MKVCIGVDLCFLLYKENLRWFCLWESEFLLGIKFENIWLLSFMLLVIKNNIGYL